MLTTVTDVIAATRYLLQDVNGEIWTDDELRNKINEGQRIYSEKTKCLKTDFDLMTYMESGNYPDNFTEYVFGINDQKQEIIPTSFNRLYDCFGDEFEDITGNTEAIWDDHDNPGAYHIFPVKEQNLTKLVENQWQGEILEIVGSANTYDNWGLINGISGYHINGIWGTTQFVDDYDYIGGIQYIRKSNDDVIEIRDYDILQYYAAAQALLMETERNNKDMAKIMMGLFDNMIGQEIELINIAHGKNSSKGEFF